LIDRLCKLFEGGELIFLFEERAMATSLETSLFTKPESPFGRLCQLARSGVFVSARHVVVLAGALMHG